MTKQHFEAIAQALAEGVLHKQFTDVSMEALVAEQKTIEGIAVALANQFEQFNPNFNRSKFLAVALA